MGHLTPAAAVAWIVLAAALLVAPAPAPPVGFMHLGHLAPPAPPAAACSRAIDYPRLGICVGYGTYSDCSGRTEMPLYVVDRDTCFDRLGTKYLLGHNTDPWGRIRAGRVGDVVTVDRVRYRVTGHYYAAECTGGGEAYFPAAVHLNTSSGGHCSPAWVLQLNP